MYVLNSPDAIRQALTSEARKLEKGIQFGRAKRLIGNGLVLADGSFHQRQRRLMQPAFHRAEIARYTRTMQYVAIPRIEGWQDGSTLAFDREMRSITLTVVTRALLSSDVGAEVIDEIERLLRVLLAELMPKGVVAQLPVAGAHGRDSATQASLTHRVCRCHRKSSWRGAAGQRGWGRGRPALVGESHHDGLPCRSAPSDPTIVGLT